MKRIAVTATTVPESSRSLLTNRMRNSRQLRPQHLIRRPGGVHDPPEIRRVEMARDKAERFQRLQQRRQHGHDVVHHGLTHRADSCLPHFA